MKMSTALGNVTNAGRVKQDWGYLVPRDRLERRYDNVKAPEPQGKGQIVRGRGKKKDSAKVWRPVPWGLGQWSHF